MSLLARLMTEITTTDTSQLLAPANEALTNECLTGPITEYSWVEGICLMSVFVLFFVELMVMRFARFGHSHDHDVEHQPRYAVSQFLTSTIY
jgi:zinc transporter 1/2/3